MVSCASPSFCAAGDRAGDVLTYNGTSWAVATPDAGNEIDGLTCPSSTFCLAAGDPDSATYLGMPTPDDCATISDSDGSLLGDGLASLDKARVPFGGAGVDAGTVAFELYANAGLSNSSLCAANVSVKDVNPLLGGPDGVSVNVAGGPPPGFRIFSYNVLSGWDYQPASPDWNVAPSVGPFVPDWSQAGVVFPPINYSLDDLSTTNPTMTAFPVLNVNGPQLTTELMGGSYQNEPVYLSASLTPQVQFGVKAVLELTKLQCLIDVEQFNVLNLLPGFSQDVGGLVELSTASTAKKDLLAATNDLLITQLPALQGLENVVTAASQTAQLMKVMEALYLGSCTQGVEDAEDVDAVAELAVVAVAAGAVVLPEFVGGLVLKVGQIVVTRVGAPALGFGFASKASHPVSLVHLPHGISRLRATKATLALSELSRAPFPRGAALRASIARVQSLGTEVAVGRLLITNRLRPGARLSVLAARLRSSKGHRVLLMLIGPGYTGEAFLTERNHLAGATIMLPRRMDAGGWILAVIDDAGLHFKGKTLVGTSDVRLTTFQIRAPHKKHRKGKTK